MLNAIRDVSTEGAAGVPFTNSAGNAAEKRSYRMVDRLLPEMRDTARSCAWQSCVYKNELESLLTGDVHASQHKKGRVS